jgi:hypothetical protein
MVLSTLLYVVVAIVVIIIIVLLLKFLFSAIFIMPVTLEYDYVIQYFIQTGLVT